MKKEYVVKNIDTPTNNASYVMVSLTPIKDFQEGIKPPSQFDASKMTPSNMNDMLKDLSKMLSGIGNMPGGNTSLKIDMHEYKKMDLSVGDKVFLELTKDKNSEFI